MDALDILDVRAEVCRVIDFVLEQDARDFIPNKIRRLHSIITRIQEIILQRSSSDGELEVATGFHISIANSSPPHLDSVSRHAIFGRRFLVFAVVGFV